MKSFTENRKVVLSLPFICKHDGTLVKTIRCKKTKASRIFAIFTESLYFLKNFKKSHLFIEELYTRLYYWYMFKALSLLVSKCDAHSKGYSSISILFFFFRFCASLKVI